MMKKSFLFLLSWLPFFVNAQVIVTVDLTKDTHVISPYIYGRNNSLSGNPGSNFTTDWTRLKDAGVKFFREGGGNNSTKYNWRKKISSHPDWYNNVYANDWSAAAQSLQQNMPSAQGMWTFQLIGKAAMTTTANFNDWGYNSSQWWTGVNQNLAGGGQPNTSGGNKALVEGNPNLYLQDWTADSTTLILDNWFSTLGLDKTKLKYWNMDNEPEIWNGTHDDVMPTQLSAEDFMQRYFEVAKKARAKYPDIKLVGPVTANEWQWYNWSGGINSGGKNYSWLEYFIKRIGEEQAASGVRLLDVLDLHFYPGSTNASDVVQYHRVFFDQNYVYPEANGVKNVNGSWDNSQTKEYIFERCKTWLTQYIGTNHGVTFGITEAGISNINANTSAVWYAGMLGEFMKHPEMEIFTPWTWQVGMWETLHLFSRYNKDNFVQATSSDEVNVSAYPTINATNDSLTVILVNRSTSVTKSVTVNFNGFTLAQESFQVRKLASLPSSETFNSHTSNALQKSTVNQNANAINISLSPMSITMLQLKGAKGGTVTGVEKQDPTFFNAFPNPVSVGSKTTVEINKTGYATLHLLDAAGKTISIIYDGDISTSSFKKELDLNGLSKGMYILKLHIDREFFYRKVIVH
jgi:hypothetical protein